MFKIYYSRSNGVNDSEMGIHLQDFIEHLPAKIRKNIILTRHQRGKMYDSTPLEEADLVIVGTKNFLKPYDVTSIGKGCFSEIEKAEENDIPVLLITKDLKTDKVFLQKITGADVTELDEDDDDTSWANFAEITHFAKFSDCEDIDEDEIDEDIYNPYGSYAAHTDNSEEIESLLRMLYDTGDIKKFTIPSNTPNLPPSETLQDLFGMWKNSSPNDEELLLLRRVR